MAIAVIHHKECAAHEAPGGHPEQPARIMVIQKALEQFPFNPPLKFYQPPLATREQLITVHDEDYVDWIFSIAPKDKVIQVDPDTWMNPHTLKAALYAAGSVPFAVDLVMRGEVEAAFCNVRPPGHHAERDKAMGFCFFNNVAVGVQQAISVHGLQRVAIIDFDVHHGNGTQQIFQNEKKVFYCSSFEHPFYPGYDAEMDNAHILSIPLPAGTNGDVFREKVKAAWFEQLVAFQPQFIFFSAGFDAHADDPLADLALTRDDYVWLTTEIAKIAKVSGNGRMVSVLEGGYNLQALAECVPAHVNAMQTMSTAGF